MKTRWAPVVTLGLLSPVTAEFLLGDQYLTGAVAPIPVQIGELILFALFYGVGAVLIREVAQRLRTGWLGIWLLALAFAIVEEGLLTQSLFNPNYLGQHELALGHLGPLGMGAPWTVYVLSLHVIWSICSPIAIAHTAFADFAAGDGRWLGRVGTPVMIILFVVGAAATFATNLLLSPSRFIAEPPQLLGTAVVAAILIIGVVRLRGRADRAEASSRLRGLSDPRLWLGLGLGLGIGLVGGLALQLVRIFVDGDGWLQTALMVGVWVIGSVAIRACRAAPLGLATGAMIVYFWVGMSKAVDLHAAGIAEQSALVLVVGLLIAVTWWRWLRPREELATSLVLTATAASVRDGVRNDGAS